MLGSELCQPIRGQPGSVRTNERAGLVTPSHGDTSVTAGGERKWLVHREIETSDPTCPRSQTRPGSEIKQANQCPAAAINNSRSSFPQTIKIVSDQKLFYRN